MSRGGPRVVGFGDVLDREAGAADAAEECFEGVYVLATARLPEPRRRGVGQGLTGPLGMLEFVAAPLVRHEPRLEARRRFVLADVEAARLRDPRHLPKHHGHVGQVFGGTIVRAKQLMHGKVDRIEHTGKGLFAGLASPIEATRYHSLVIDPPTLPKDFEVDAWAAAPDGSREIMAIRHKTLPVYGVQFHPESFLTPAGYDLLRAFLRTGVGVA